MQKMIWTFTDQQKAQEMSGEDSLDLMTAKYSGEINWPIPRYIKLTNDFQVKEYCYRGKTMIITLTSSYWDLWIEHYWKPINNERRTDLSQSFFIEPRETRIYVTGYDYELSEDKITDSELVEDVSIDQIQLQTGNADLGDEDDFRYF